MENNTIPVSGAVVCSLVILVFLTACMTVLVPVVRAEETNNTFFTDWNVVQTGGGVHIDLPPPFILPPTIPVDLLNKGTYTGPCPVGTNGAPLLLDTNLKSKAICRGACGPDCPKGRCVPVQDIKGIPSTDGTGTCTYKNVIRCPTHQGCQEHDACYDYCEDNGYTHIWDGCHLQCNQRCYDKYGRGTCTPWADLPGRAGSLGTTTADWWVSPQYSQNPLTFSDPPEFTPHKALPSTPPTTVPTPFITPQTPPATVLTPPTTTIVPATTPVVTKTVSGPDTHLTVIMTGDLSVEDMEGTTVGWSPEAREQSCSGGQCILKFPYGTSVDVAVFPSGNVRFIGWSGSCSGSGDCTVTMTKDKTVTAQFIKITKTTPITNYQDYCTENYPGSVYDREIQSCVFHGVTPTTTNYASGSRPTLIPVAGECCPAEPCSTQVASASGGTPPYTFSSGSFAGGAPPMGMLIDVNGYLTGTAPSAVGTYSLSVCVKDLAGQSDCGESYVIVS